MILILQIGKGSIYNPPSKARWHAGGMDGSEIQERITYSGSPLPHLIFLIRYDGYNSNLFPKY